MSKAHHTPRVLLIHKITTWERYRSQVQSSAEELADGLVLASLRDAHAEHGETLEAVEAVLDHHDLEVRTAQVATSVDTQWADLVVTLGGDGTFLRSARFVVDAPILGVNSAPSSSVGHYCGATAATFEDVLPTALSGAAEVTELPRIRIGVGPLYLEAQALNDVLFANACPACSTRYRVEVDGRSERHTSSGVWVGTSAGSGSALRSAGGQVMSWTDPRLQYVVREPYVSPGGALSLLHGFLEDGITLVPRSPDVMLYLDGHHVSYRLSLGVPVSLHSGGAPLKVIGYRPRQGASQTRG